MSVKIKIDPLAIDIPAMLAGGTVAQQRTIAAQFAWDGIDKADAINRRVLGRIPPRTITVDGTPNAPLESVNPDGGSIIAEWELIGGVLLWIADTLVERSPQVSGAYKHGHTLYADGVPTSVDQDIPPAEVYTFLNTVPYARRLEVGKTESGRDFLIQVPNRIYDRTARDAKSLFGHVADITSSFDYPVDGYRLKHDQASRSFAGGRLRVLPGQRKDRIKGSYITVPAILVRLKKS